MKHVWPRAAKILTGLSVTAMYALPQAYTISAKPGVVSYVEGNASVNGRDLPAHSSKQTFLKANDVLSTDLGKAEVLLSPGIFLRLGANTQVRMVSPSLTDTRVEVKKGEAMVEADDIVKDSGVSVLDGDSVTTIDRNGLYRFTADGSHRIAVLEGKAQVTLGDRHSEITKGHEASLDDNLKTAKVKADKDDDLYAWSNVRSEYNAASTYQAAKEVNTSNYGGVWGDYGFGGWSTPGWAFNSGLNSWAWLPGNSAYYSPFGYGFYGPGLVAFAPVVYAPVYGGGGWINGYRNRTTQSGGSSATRSVTAAVPVNAAKPPAIGNVTARSFTSLNAARVQSAQGFNSTGYRTAGGGTISAARAASMFNAGGGRFGGSAARGGAGNYGGGGSYAGASGAGHASAGFAGASSAGAAHGGSVGSVGGGAHR